MIDLRGKVVLVTGASRGIGAVIAGTVAHAGGDVVVHYGNERAGAESVAASIGADRCRIVQADLAEPGAGARLWAGAVAWKGRVDVLVNNAAVALTSAARRSVTFASEKPPESSSTSRAAPPFVATSRTTCNTPRRKAPSWRS